jgi:serine/threonine-protein kinase
VAALSHPNVLAIFDVGGGDPPYLVTELLDGETLRMRLERGPVPLKPATDIALQLLAGLSAAHGRGIVHRDLKPDNLFVTSGGVLKILDFGLAKAVRAEGGNSDRDITQAGATAAGMVVGTVGYMAPEQVRGESTDPRSDIFAVGTILYELVSGRRAFEGRSPADTMSAVLREQPADLSLNSGTPLPLARIVRRCLEKEPADRFQTVRDLQFAIESLSDGHPQAAPARTDEKSVAVLPFANMSAEVENQYFSDGLSEELINALTRLPGLRVASRTSSFRFRGDQVDIREIGRQLHVTTVLEGSVRRAGNRLRITAQLINIADGYHLWSERYDREMADVFAIQDEIVEAIVKALAPALAGEGRAAARRPTDNLEAYELYLKGRHYWHQRSPGNLQAAVQCFERVIALDPEYALAHAGLADCYAIYRVYGWHPFERCRPPAVAAVARAMALDPTLAEVHYSQALVAYYFERQWRKAETHLRQALAINPRLAMARAYLAILLGSHNRFDEAQVELEAARAAEPLSPFIHYLAAAAAVTAGRVEAAVECAQRVLDLQPDSLQGYWLLSVALSRLGQHAEAIAAAERVVTLSREPLYIGILGGAYAYAGRGDDAARLAAELVDRRSRGEYVTPAAGLTIAVALGDAGAVREALEGCVADQTPPLTIQVACPVTLDAMRSDPEIDRLVRILYDNTG